MRKKLTDWFPMHMHPSRAGVYRMRYAPPRERHTGRFSKWDGEKWCITHDSAGFAATQSDSSYDIDHKWVDGWRGLAEQPK